MIVFTYHNDHIGVIAPEQIDSFPFPFNGDFSRVFAELHGAKYQLVCFKGHFEGFIPVMFKTSKLMTTLKFLYNPTDVNGNVFSPENEKQIINAFLNFLNLENRVDRILQPVNWMLFQSYPDSSKSVPFGTYVLDLNLGEAQIWEGMHSKHRNVIRNAEKKRAIFKSGPGELDTFYELYQRTMSRSNMYCESKVFFTKMISQYAQNVFCAVAYSDEVPQGGLFVPYTREGAYYVYGASPDKVSLTGAVNWLHNEMIKSMIQKGVKKYDFVGARLSDISGTKLEGIQKFKSRFGGELKRGYLWKMDLNKYKCRLYDRALSVKLKFTGKMLHEDIIDQEYSKFK